MTSQILQLYEKLTTTPGIDVQAELKTITSPATGRAPQHVPQPTPAQRAMMNQHQNVRRASGPSPRHLQAQKSSSSTTTSQSPQLQPTPTSQTSSPVASKSPSFAMQGAMLSPYPGFQAQQQVPQTMQAHPPPPPPPPSRGNTYPPIRPYPGPPVVTSGSNLQSAPLNTSSGQSMEGRSGVVRPRSNPWPSPYQTHIEQLGQLTRPLLSFCTMELCSS